MKKSKIAKTRAKKAVPVEQKDGFWLSAYYIVLGLLTLPFWVLGHITRPLYSLMVRFPNRSSILLGIFRIAVYFGIIMYVSEHYETMQEIKGWMLGFVSEGVYKFLAFSGNVFVMINFLLSLLVAGGAYNGLTGSISSETSGYSSIDEAFRYRDGVASMQSTSGKVEEYAKTSFMNQDTIRSLSNNKNMSEAMRYLDGKLAMQSTSGKYEMMKKMFGGNK